MNHFLTAAMTSYSAKALGDLLKQTREESGLSLEEMAENLGMKADNLFLIEEGNEIRWNNRRLINTIDLFCRYGKKLCFSVEELPERKLTRQLDQVNELKALLHKFADQL